MDYVGRRILVTGGAGFIGSHLVDVLAHARPASLHVVDNLFLGREENLDDARRTCAALRFHRMDAADDALSDLIRREHVEIVFNLATKALGHSFTDPLETFHVNVQITGRLLEALRRHDIQRLIHVSSSEAYGSAVTVPMSESHPLLPQTPYAAGKAAADLMVSAYQETFGCHALIVRPFNNYGPRQNEGLYAGVIPLTMARILRGEAPVIEGNGDQTRDFIFVRDTARIVVELAKRDDLLGRVLNLGTGMETSIKELIDRICKVAGYSGPIRQVSPRPGDVTRQCADIRALRAVVGSLVPHPLNEGLSETWEWYRSHVGAVMRRG